MRLKIIRFWQWFEREFAGGLALSMTIAFLLALLVTSKEEAREHSLAIILMGVFLTFLWLVFAVRPFCRTFDDQGYRK